MTPGSSGVGDPILRKALERAQARFEARKESWSPTDEEAADASQEATQHAQNALTHLGGGRWDEADAAANLCLELEEEFGSGKVWREFAFLVEEAAALGRA